MDKGPYLGTVLSNQDPAKLGRVKVNVPHVYGVSDSALGTIGLTDIPWALPAGLPAGGSPSSGGIDWLPDPGDQVMVFFLDGEPEKPVWMWLMQSLDQQKSFPLHHYSQAAAVGSPDRAGLTRYGHTIELNSGSALISTKSGYHLFMLNGDIGANNGQILIQTPLGQYLEFDDSTQTSTYNVTLDSYFNIGSTWQAQADEIDFETMNRDITMKSGLDFTVDTDNDISLTSAAATNISTGTTFGLDVTTNYTATVSGNMNTDVTGSCNFTFGTLNLGATATQPFVLGNQLMEFLNVLMIYLAGHTHGNGNNGSPTTPPIVPPQATAQTVLETILSATIKGQ